MFVQEDLLNLFIEAAKTMFKEENRCGHLVFTQKENGKYIIREPEVTCVFTTLLTDKGIDFGVEVPTERHYRISGLKSDSANIDLVLFHENEQVNIEFKTRQPTVKAIEKDFLKFFGEEIPGCGFFHILKNRHGKTLHNLLDKYKNSYLDVTKKNIKRHQKWFLFFIFVKETKEYYWKLFNDLTSISADEFQLDNFRKVTNHG